MKELKNSPIGPVCPGCIHYLFKNGVPIEKTHPAQCAAFPDKIPKKIYERGDPHTKPTKSQTNKIVFEAHNFPHGGDRKSSSHNNELENTIPRNNSTNLRSLSIST